MQSEELNQVTKGIIFDELDPAERIVRKVKSDLWRMVVDEIERRGLTQTAAAKVLKIHQPDVSHLMKGRISRFTVQQLLMFAARISPKMTLSLKAPQSKPAEAQKARSRAQRSRKGSLTGMSAARPGQSPAKSFAF
jgi:predicted XRE-type DNA-binding protein